MTLSVSPYLTIPLRTLADARADRCVLACNRAYAAMFIAPVLASGRHAAVYAGGNDPAPGGEDRLRSVHRPNASRFPSIFGGKQ